MNLKTASHLFSQVLGCHTALHALTLTVRDGPPTLETVVNFLLIFMTPPNHTAQKMKGGGSSARGSGPGLPWLGGLGRSSRSSNLSLCAPNPRGPWTMSHSGLGREQRSHLTRGLTSRLVGVWRRPEERHTSPCWKLDQLVPSDDPGCDRFHFAPLTSKSSLISP